MSQKARILVVDDDDIDLELTLDALREAGVQASIEVARGGRAALDRLLACGGLASRSGESPPHLVLLDLRMAGMDGFEVLRAIKGSVALRRIPVVVFTTSADSHDIARCYELGANGYVVKPVGHLDLIESARGIRSFWLQQNLPWDGAEAG